ENAVKRSCATVAQIDQKPSIVFRKPDAVFDFKLPHRRLGQWRIQLETVGFSTKHPRLPLCSAKAFEAIANCVECCVHGFAANLLLDARSITLSRRKLAWLFSRDELIKIEQHAGNTGPGVERFLLAQPHEQSL